MPTDRNVRYSSDIIEAGVAAVAKRRGFTYPMEEGDEIYDIHSIREDVRAALAAIDHAVGDLPAIHCRIAVRRAGER